MIGKVQSVQVNHFIQYLNEQERSKATIEKYRRDLNKFFQFFHTGGELSKQTVIAYKEALVKRYAVSSVNSMLAAVNTFLQFSGLDAYRVKPLKIQRRIFSSREEELTKEDYFALLNTARKKGKMRLLILLQTLCATGIRVSELDYITVEAAKQHRACVFCKGKNRLVFLPKQLCGLLLQYCDKMKIRTGKIFLTKGLKSVDRVNIWKEMKQLCEPAGIPPKKVFPHNLRHLFARTYYQGEKDLARLADVLGHSSVETTRIYILSTGEEQEIQVGGLKLLEMDYLYSIT